MYHKISLLIYIIWDMNLFMRMFQVDILKGLISLIE